MHSGVNLRRAPIRSQFTVTSERSSHSLLLSLKISRDYRRVQRLGLAAARYARFTSLIYFIGRGRFSSHSCSPVPGWPSACSLSHACLLDVGSLFAHSTIFMGILHRADQSHVLSSILSQLPSVEEHWNESFRLELLFVTMQQNL